MKKIFIISLALASLLSAKSEMQTCKKCHATIVEEFKDSMHKNSSHYTDEIHKAVWDKHPAKSKNDYECAKCHAPNAKTEDEIKEGITCSSCHTIVDVEKHAPQNSNVYSQEKKTFYSAEASKEGKRVLYKKESSMLGMNKTTTGSAYHTIDYSNSKFYTGEVCMGCHSHKTNSKEVSVCKTGDAGAQSKKENCITCHMPKINGSATSVRESSKHAFHGFAGARKNPQMLAKYVELAFAKSDKGFEIFIVNRAPHDLLTHPLRVAELRIKIIRGTQTIVLTPKEFKRVIGHDGKPAMPWAATEVLVDNMVKASSKEVVAYENALQAGDKVEAVLGFYVVNPKSVENLGLSENEKVKKFTVLKEQYFTVK